MGENNSKTKSERINVWLQNIAIVIAGVWAVTVFFTKEYYIPSNSPTEITAGIKLEAVANTSSGMVGDDRGRIPINVTVTATNPSTRTLYLLPCVWLATGSRFDKRSAEISDFHHRINKTLDSINENYVQRFYKDTKRQYIAAGRLFAVDTIIDPKETLKRTFVLLIPKQKYDYIELHAFFPNSTKKDNAVVKWKLVGDIMTPAIYRNGVTSSKGNDDLQMSTALSSVYIPFNYNGSNKRGSGG